VRSLPHFIGIEVVAIALPKFSGLLLLEKCTSYVASNGRPIVSDDFERICTGSLPVPYRRNSNEPCD
jgi:hypothetical protein